MLTEITEGTEKARDDFGNSQNYNFDQRRATGKDVGSL